MSEFGDFAPLIDAIDDLTARLAPVERAKLSREAATDLRRANAERIARNVTPAGEPMTPRKSRRPRRLAAGVAERRQGLMFRSAGKPKFLRKRSSADGLEVGYAGAMARIMRVHQEGLRDTVTRDPSSPAVTYPARPTLGLTPEDRLRLLDRVAAQVQP